MAHFDDIPISKIQKMPGYQTGAMMGDASTEDTTPTSGADPVGGVPGNLEDEDALEKPLAERAQNPSWKIRIAAYKEINNLFYSDYAQFELSKGTPEYGAAGNVDLLYNFEQYGPLLDKIIRDSNMNAALEGLQVMLTYMKHAADIKAVTFASHNYLLEKVAT